MTAHAEPTSGKPRTRRPHVRGLLVLVIGCVATLSPFFTGTLAHFVVGSLLIVCGALEMLEIFQAADESRRLSAYLAGALSIVAGLLLLVQPQLLLRGLALFVAGSFAIDGIGKIAAAERCRRAGASWRAHRSLGRQPTCPLEWQPASARISISTPHRSRHHPVDRWTKSRNGIWRPIPLAFQQ